MANGRCRMHGGATRNNPAGKHHWNFKHGLRTKEFQKEMQELRALVDDVQAIDKLLREIDSEKDESNDEEHDRSIPKY